jgi:hypothetical protein
VTGDPLLSWRPEFPILETTRSLISYTDDAELTAAFAAIDEIRKSGAWRRWANRPAVVT